MGKTYETYCAKSGGQMHIIAIDFFDCILVGSDGVDVELTLKNFANCMAYVPECQGFNQEHILQEAWSELGLNCVLEEEETKDPPKEKEKIDDDIAKKEKEAASEGADDVEKKEENSEYIPKEEKGSDGKRKKKKFGFMKMVLFLS